MRSQLLVTVLTCIVILLFLLLSVKVSDTEQSIDNQLQILVQQRNELSQLANQLKQTIGQLECEGNEIVSSGAWCRKTVGIGHFIDKPLAGALAEFFDAGDTVASFGDGIGKYRTLLLSSSEVSKFDSFDGSPFIENATHNNVSFLDLTLPLYHLPLYDWVMLLEVGEHVPRKHEKTVVSNVARFAQKGIIVSWAQPNQVGIGHINPRPQQHVISTFSAHGFTFDRAASNRLRRRAHYPWFQRNLVVMVRR